jgi:hypothetical protein
VTGLSLGGIIQKPNREEVRIMAPEDVATNIPSLTTPAMHPEPEPSANVPTGMPLLPPPAEAPGAGGHIAQGGYVSDDLRKEGPSILIEFRTAELPRWRPRIIVDQRRNSRDDA